jgi:membrane protein DedA with SNARE-associated domain
VTQFIADYGLWVVFVVVFFEVAGLPFIPGEAALIAAAALANRGHGSIAAIVALAFAAAVLGALVGYFVGERWGRTILTRFDWFERLTHKGVEKSEHFFERHGAKAVFLGRFVPVLRATLGWMAGLGRMRFRTFLVWNVLGAAAWSCLIGLLAYYVGGAVIKVIEKDLLYGVLALLGVGVVFFVVHRLMRRVEN